MPLNINRGMIPDNNIIIGNVCTDDQVSKTQDYGIVVEANVTNTILVGNALVGNDTAPIDDLGTTTRVDGLFLAKPTVTGARDDGTALADLLTELETLGLLTDSSTAS